MTAIRLEPKALGMLPKPSTTRQILVDLVSGYITQDSLILYALKQSQLQELKALCKIAKFFILHWRISTTTRPLYYSGKGENMLEDQLRDPHHSCLSIYIIISAVVFSATPKYRIPDYMLKRQDYLPTMTHHSRAITDKFQVSFLKKYASLYLTIAFLATTTTTAIVTIITIATTTTATIATTTVTTTITATITTTATSTATTITAATTTTTMTIGITSTTTSFITTTIITATTTTTNAATTTTSTVTTTPNFATTTTPPAQP
ncbi:hypothetical protein E2542_SST02126 [Spatholobus suberectus]|nr:hypothetical protein E2542_SST02126 [Spatholobus suberectus]